jgi:exodeoxyribonuclease VII large subunit
MLLALRSRMDLAESRLVAVGPEATLLRGYAIARTKDGLILASEDAKVGDVVELILGRGRLRCRVLECIGEGEF